MDQLVTREGDLFQVSDHWGDMLPEAGPLGLYMHDSRYLSRLEMLLGGNRPQLLSSTAEENYIQRVYLQAGVADHMFYHAKVGVQRQRVLHGGVMYERIRIENAELHPASLSLEVRFDADFVDLFEVRGMARSRRGELKEPVLDADRVTLGYLGLDGRLRQTSLHFAPAPSRLTAAHAEWNVALEARASWVIDIVIRPAENGLFPPVAGFDEALRAVRERYAAWAAACTTIETGHALFDRVLERSVADLCTLTADLGHGDFPVAGVPWFAVPFGRDSIITAIEALALNPELARGTLRTLAALQGQAVNAFRVEEPGKIPHELRAGEMANLNEVPFGRYYGSVDSTPLFLVLAAQYYAWTGDLELMRELLPPIRSALTWVDSYGDPDGDGFLEYWADAERGLMVQSWKDSPDSMCHRDGRKATGAIAVSEVQGYAYAAKRGLAPVMAALGEADASVRVTAEAAALRERFHQAFWMEDRQFFAIALDGAKAQVGTVSSDIGQCLWTGIVAEETAGAVATRLLADDMFSGWGIRTLSAQEATYNPMSYHNGSVWPHDNALTVLGLMRYGFHTEAQRVIAGLVDTAASFEYFRLPELFCGYAREGAGPVQYPVACSPQAWAAATPFALVQAMLGLEPDAPAGVLRLRPCLPPWLPRLAVRGLRVGGARVDLEVTPAGVRAEVTGELRVEVVGTYTK